MGSEVVIANATLGEAPLATPTVNNRRFRVSRVLLAHILATVLTQSVWFGIATIMPLLARKRFAAGDWQTLLVTGAVPTLLMMSIFWNEILRRMSLRQYMLVHWAALMLPMLAAAFAQSFWHLIACYAVAAIGSSGWSPLAGDVLKRIYDDNVRGRAFGLITTAIYSGMMLTSFYVGKLLDADANSFRWYLPAGAGLYLLGMLLFRRLVRLTGADAARRSELMTQERINLRRLFGPVMHMTRVLRQDVRFSRYEAAFMTYGMGWMICNALLPILATDRLHMTYSQFAESTQVTYPLGLLLMLYPMGYMMDKLGPSRTSGLSFALLTLYPLGLMTAGSVTMVAATSVVYGASMAGVQIAWTLGPVSLAPSPEKVAEYVAIHASLVGIRGVVAQVLAMFLYRVTGSFYVPMVIAALSFLWAALQMSKMTRMTLCVAHAAK